MISCADTVAGQNGQNERDREEKEEEDRWKRGNSSTA